MSVLRKEMEFDVFAYIYITTRVNVYTILSSAAQPDINVVPPPMTCSLRAASIAVGMPSAAQPDIMRMKEQSLL